MNHTKSTMLKKLDQPKPREAVKAYPGMRSFWGYYLAIFHKPRRAFEALMADGRRLRFGTIAVLIPAFLYTLFYFMASEAGGAPSTFKPWLAIPIEEYFYWERYIVAPSMLLSWIVAAGFAQLLSRGFSGKGSFEDNLSVFGFSISIASWALLVHDLTDAFLGFIGVIDMKAYELALNSPTFWRALWWTLALVYMAWYILLFSTGIGASQRLRRGPAIGVGVTAFLVYQLVFLIFNR